MINEYTDTSVEAEKKLVEISKKMSMAQRFSRTRSLTSTVINLSRKAIRNANPGISERELDILFVKYHYGNDLARSVKECMEARGI